MGQPNALPRTVDARPVKRFFVEMLTRDLAIEDAILDLLDNCVDGILRTLPQNDLGKEKPYAGRWAKIVVSATQFEISDNCGGIPSNKTGYAFRMGRPEEGDSKEPERTVGVYGIGMKRAIFKMGNDATVLTQNATDVYSVRFSPEWIHSEDSWELNIDKADSKMPEDGTTIAITHLNPSIVERFDAESFLKEILDRIGSHYAVIIDKGFQVTVNGQSAVAKPIQLRFALTTQDKKSVRPYVFKGEFEGVDIFLTVGLREPIPGFETVLEQQDEVKFSSEFAGWTVICNDRVVLYCNKDELTGWGTIRVPQYHTQFIAISGVVEFSGDASKLPTNTTKRGLDFSSRIYQRVLNRMREGIYYFIDFTNKWKTMEEEARQQVNSAPPMSFVEIKQQVASKEFVKEMHKVTQYVPGEQYVPKLPLPLRDSPNVRISYMESKERVKELEGQLLEDLEDVREADRPRRVGQASFDYAYNRLIKDKES